MAEANPTESNGDTKWYKTDGKISSDWYGSYDMIALKRWHWANAFRIISLQDASKNGCQELTSTKENLKQFIERWEEHPNSPYIFDSTTTLILPVHDNERNTSSGFSSRGCSPSPCESLSSNVDLNEQDSEATVENDSSARMSGDFTHENGDTQPESLENGTTTTNKQNKGYLQSFDRRHSDSNYITRNRTSSLDKVDLADEIKKLSDRLMILSSINDELQELNKNGSNGDAATGPSTIKPTETATNVKASSFDDSFSSSTEHSETLTTKKKRNEKQSTTSATTTTTTTTTTKTTIHSKSLHGEGSSLHHTSSVVSDLTERLRSLDEMPSVFKKLIKVNNFTDKCDESTSTTAIKESFNFAASLNASMPPNGYDSTYSATQYQSTPWPITTRRTKFRVTQLSRDVPIGSPDSHQTIFLEEAANTTKDCLLHLLDKYNTKQSRANSSIRRHQSISGHGITDNLEYHSMNSINAFFKRNAFHHNGRTVRSLKARIESRDQQ